MAPTAWNDGILCPLSLELFKATDAWPRMNAYIVVVRISTLPKRPFATYLVVL